MSANKCFSALLICYLSKIKFKSLPTSSHLYTAFLHSTRMYSACSGCNSRNLFRRRTTKFSHLPRYVHFCFHRAVKQIFRCISEHWASALVHELHLMRCISPPRFLLSLSQDPLVKSHLLVEFMTMFYGRLAFFLRKARSERMNVWNTSEGVVSINLGKIISVWRKRFLEKRECHVRHEWVFNDIAT